MRAKDSWVRSECSVTGPIPKHVSDQQAFLVYVSQRETLQGSRNASLKHGESTLVGSAYTSQWGYFITLSGPMSEVYAGDWCRCHHKVMFCMHLRSNSYVNQYYAELIVYVQPPHPTPPSSPLRSAFRWSPFDVYCTTYWYENLLIPYSTLIDLLLCKSLVIPITQSPTKLKPESVPESVLVLGPTRISYIDPGVTVRHFLAMDRYPDSE